LADIQATLRMDRCVLVYWFTFNIYNYFYLTYI
jgi:hypothetical protein